MAFFSQLSEILKSKAGLQPEGFLQYKAAADHHEEFIRTAREFLPFIGLARRWNAPIPKLPTPEEMKRMVDEKRTFDVGASAPDYCYWFLKKK